MVLRGTNWECKDKVDMKNNYTIFCDQDGVLAQFIEGASLAHNRPLPYGPSYPNSYGIWDTEKLWNISANEFWAPLEGPTFWEELTEYPEALDLINLCERVVGRDQLAILTSPSLSPYCVTGKRKWVKARWPWLEKNMIFTSAKRFLARGTSILIDDRDKNLEDWQEAGGLAIQYPRPWNSGWKLDRDGEGFRYIQKRLETLL